MKDIKGTELVAMMRTVNNMHLVNSSGDVVVNGFEMKNPVYVEFIHDLKIYLPKPVNYE